MPARFFKGPRCSDFGRGGYGGGQSEKRGGSLIYRDPSARSNAADNPLSPKKAAAKRCTTDAHQVCDVQVSVLYPRSYSAKERSLKQPGRHKPLAFVGQFAFGTSFPLDTRVSRRVYGIARVPSARFIFPLASAVLFYTSWMRCGKHMVGVA